MVDPMSDIQIIASGIELPNGSVVPNRLVKAAMEEGISHTGGLPGPEHCRLYKTWGEGGWGVIVTGNVQVDRKHLATPHDRFIPDSSAATIASYARLHQSTVSSAPTGQAPLTLVQISHPGLQASAVVSMARAPWSRSVAPISARPDLGNGWLAWILAHAFWPMKSRPLVRDEWMAVVGKFVRAAKVIEQAGWGGVQIHSAHGYLLAEYLSPHTNPSPEPLPGAPSDMPLRLQLLYLVLHGIYEATEKNFVVSIKINCSDFVQGGLTEEESSEIVKTIVSWGIVDVLEISGGTYANPAFASPETISKPSSGSTRQSLFAHFTTSLLPHLPPPPSGPAILLTGGLHDRSLIASSLRNRACDLVGIGRPACVKPHLPRDIILNKQLPEEQTYLGGYDIPGGDTIRQLFGDGHTSRKGEMTGTETKLPKRVEDKAKRSGIPMVGAGVSSFWHEMQLIRIGRGAQPDMTLHWVVGLFLEFFWWGVFRGGPVAWFGTGKEERSKHS